MSWSYPSSLGDFLLSCEVTLLLQSIVSSKPRNFSGEKLSVRNSLFAGSAADHRIITTNHPVLGDTLRHSMRFSGMQTANLMALYPQSFSITDTGNTHYSSENTDIMVADTLILEPCTCLWFRLRAENNREKLLCCAETNMSHKERGRLFCNVHTERRFSRASLSRCNTKTITSSSSSIHPSATRTVAAGHRVHDWRTVVRGWKLGRTYTSCWIHAPTVFVWRKEKSVMS